MRQDVWTAEKEAHDALRKAKRDRAGYEASYGREEALDDDEPYDMDDDEGEEEEEMGGHHDHDQGDGIVRRTLHKLATPLQWLRGNRPYHTDKGVDNNNNEEDDDEEDGYVAQASETVARAGRRVARGMKTTAREAQHGLARGWHKAAGAAGDVVDEAKDRGAALASDAYATAKRGARRAGRATASAVQTGAEQTAQAAGRAARTAKDTVKDGVQGAAHRARALADEAISTTARVARDGVGGFAEYLPSSSSSSSSVCPRVTQGRRVPSPHVVAVRGGRGL
jgi:hypothetical protein